jgi:hypothetical protein
MCTAGSNPPPCEWMDLGNKYFFELLSLTDGGHYVDAENVQHTEISTLSVFLNTLKLCLLVK